MYHATRWGVEGFLEAVAQEVAPLGIACIIAEPGPTRTNFGTNLTVADPMAAYADTPAGAIRRAITDGSFFLKGDAVRTASLIIDAAKSESLPLRLALGSTAYNSISSALKSRLALLQTQRDAAMLADRTDL